MSKKDLIKLRKKLRRIQKDLLNISILLDNAIDEDFVTAQAYSDMSSDFSLNREKTQKVALKYKQNQETKAKEDTKKKLPEKLPEKLPKLDITNPNWPEALPENFIPRNDEEEKTRADLIISRLPIQLQGKILDFGCGEGFLAASLKEKGNDIIGYDIVKSDKWNIFDNPEIFITDWDIIHNQVFDIIILYDTIDHLVEENIDTTFAKLKSILSEKGTIIIMAHPWTSRHGGHIYKNLNLAYVHLVLDSSELNEVCPDRPTTVISTLIADLQFQLFLNLGLLRI